VARVACSGGDAPVGAWTTGGGESEVAEKKITPKAAASKDTKGTSKAQTRVTKKVARKVTAKKQRKM
jgi:hypothetical protein